MGYSGFYCERELETKQNCNILAPILMAVSVVSFPFSRAAQLEAQGLSFLLSAGFLYHILSATSLDPNSSGPQGPPLPGFLYHILSATSLQHLVTNGSPKLLGVPRAPSAWSGFPYHISSITLSDL